MAVMLKDAALLHLELLASALGEGMILKDSSTFNIQWVGSRPVFIDIPSFECLAPNMPWTAYLQFCRMFLYPLFLQAYKGEGVQHIACACRDIYDTVSRLRARGLDFMPSPPDSYYDAVERRLPGHGEPLERLKQLGVLIDGLSDGGARPELLLQIFSKTVIGPIFFEFIQRKGDDGFGEGNFKALFESMERDQLRRGAIGQG